MKFSIQVNGSPYHSQASLMAFKFVQQALAMEHEVLRVFFYHEGVFNAFKYATPLEDEQNLTQLWSNLAQQYGVDLVICISAAQRRALLTPDEASRQSKPGDDVADGFRISGLGQWVEASLLADRFIIFG